ncbi:hypothetical protein [Aliirhizobium smilacinae]|uniref:Porin family protein n=1 Tax=Aliirhizobium smilacinae TaxID=1395944 RepID=A0A5C4XIA8_9HYPH|nr:hypothetical protein [Rhizobium smilacinae]TNM62909.1 hypothetical protein FHP24_16970 [Rhizobium smilacinae]
MRRIFSALAFAILASTLCPLPADAGDWFDWQWYGLTGPCDNKCAIMVFGGKFVETPMEDIFLRGDLSPFNWEYGDSGFIGFSASRTVASFWRERFAIETELGVGKRFGSMHESETWAALFLRYRDFPWNDYLYTTVAVSTGLNYASGISDEERARAGNDRGDRILHYLAPEITFASPQDKSKELVIRLHHRSGAYGLVSDADGGIQYLTVGLRFRF